MRVYTKIFGPGNDMIAPSDGYSNYSVDGGSGIDTFFVDASSRKFTVSEIDIDGVTTISGASGTTVSLKNIEKLIFKDGRQYTLETIPPQPPEAISGDADNTPVLAASSGEVATDEVIVNTHKLDVIVDLFGQILYLADLNETITDTSHTVEYSGAIFNWSEIDSFVTTVVRDGEFTQEFSQEITDAYPSLAGLSYQTAVSLVGIEGIQDALVLVAGVDQNYVA